MDPSRFSVGDIEYTIQAVPVGERWTANIVQTNHGKSPPEVTRVDGVVVFRTEAEALSFAVGLARDLAESHLK